VYYGTINVSNICTKGKIFVYKKEHLNGKKKKEKKS